LLRFFAKEIPNIERRMVFYEVRRRGSVTIADSTGKKVIKNETVYLLIRRKDIVI